MKKVRFIHRPQRQHGYVLVMTLALLVLASGLMVAISQAAAQHVVQARYEQDQLQRKWGQRSARQAILPFTEQILAGIEQTENRPAPQYVVSLHLGDDVFTLVLADEQAKANVNQLLERYPPSIFEERIRQAMSGTGVAPLVRLRPSIVEAATISSATTNPSAPPSLIHGPGQIFDSIDPALLLGKFQTPGPMAMMTCWGSGALNLMRADEPAMRLGLAPSLTQLQIARLIELRNRVVAVPRSSRLPAGLRPLNSAQSSGEDAVSVLLGQAGIEPKDRARIALTSQSTCHSLWIIVRDRQRLWYSLSISDETKAGAPRIESFVW